MSGGRSSSRYSSIRFFQPGDKAGLYFHEDLYKAVPLPVTKGNSVSFQAGEEGTKTTEKVFREPPLRRSKVARAPFYTKVRSSMSLILVAQAL